MTRRELRDLARLIAEAKKRPPDERLKLLAALLQC